MSGKRNCGGERGIWPDDETLKGWVKTMGYAAIAERAGVTESAVYKRLRKRNLVGIAETGICKPKASSVHHERVEAEFGLCKVEADMPATPGHLTYWQQRGNWMLGG